MEKNGRKVKVIFLVINILLSIVISYFSYQELNKYNNYSKNENNLKDNYNKIFYEKENINNDINNLEKEINTFNNLNKEIIKERDKVFELASKIEQQIKKNESNKKIIYLTFDDGPYYNTYKVLSILKDYNIKATFFTTNVNGTNCFDNSKYNCHLIYKEIAKDNHTIANHTYTHGWNKGLYTNANTFIDAVLKQEDLIKEYTGIKTNIVRFPGGSSTPGSKKESMVEKLREHGYGYVDWTAEDGDGMSLSSYNEGWRKLINSTTDNIEVVLFHDYHPITTQILPNYIKYLENNNYIILPLFYDSVMINK